MKWLVGIALIVAACGSPATVGPSPQATPATAVGPTLPPSCALAVAQLGALTKGLADNLADLKGPIQQKPFSATDAAAANVRVSATLNAFKGDGMVANLAACPDTAALAPRVSKLLTTATAAIDRAQAASITNATTQRATGVTLLKLVPEVNALAEANQTAAAALGLPHDVAVLPAGSGAPGATPPLTGGSPAPGDASTWTTAANAYLNDTFATYQQVTTAAAALGGGSAAPASQAPDQLVAGTQQALNGHLAFMTKNRARACYSGAYATDQSLAGQWATLLNAGVLPSDATPEGQAAALGFAAAQQRTDEFLDKMGSFFANCR